MPDPIALFHRAAAVADATIAAVRPDQLDLPTPCVEWDVRTLLNHVVTGNLFFVALATGAPPPDRAVSHLGDDHVAAYRAGVAQLGEVFAQPGFLDRPVPTPFGPGTGAVLVDMRFNELIAHAWDIARACGQSTDLDPEVVAASMASLRSNPRLDRVRGESGPFQAELAAPEGATDADRLAAFLGRAV